MPVELLEYKAGDIIRGLSAAMNPNKSSQTVYIQGIGNCLPARSARTAIIIALKALNLPQGARIGVPLYCCPAVFKAIEATTCKPIFIDIDPKTFCISPEDVAAKSSQLDALIPVHMFGNLCDIPMLQKVMSGKPIIEDCAQSFGSKLYGRMAGSFGAIAAFSFRSGKYLSVGEGGALYSSNADLRSRISQLIAATPMPTLGEEFAHIVKTYIRSKLRTKPLFGIIGYKLWGFYNKRTAFISKSPIILSQIFKSDLAIVRSRMAFLDSMIKAQKANAEFYLQNLQLDPSMMYFEIPGTFYNRFMFPLTFRSSGDRDEMAAYLQSQQISSSKPYEEVIEGAAKHFGYEGDCPVAERLLRRTIVIPVHHKLKKNDVNRIAKCVNAGWANIMGRDRNV